MPDFKAKMHQNRFRLGLRPRIRWGGADSAPPDPLAGLRGPTSKGRGGEGVGGVRWGGEGRGGEKRRGRSSPNVRNALTPLLIALVVDTTFVNLSSDEIQYRDILVPANPAPPVEWPLISETETVMCDVYICVVCIVSRQKTALKMKKRSTTRCQLYPIPVTPKTFLICLSIRQTMFQMQLFPLDLVPVKTVVEAGQMERICLLNINHAETTVHKLPE